jgi:hypothetical protein
MPGGGCGCDISYILDPSCHQYFTRMAEGFTLPPEAAGRHEGDAAESIMVY